MRRTRTVGFVMRWGAALAWVPGELLGTVALFGIVAAGLAFILGARSAGSKLFSGALLVAFLPALLPLFDSLIETGLAIMPGWMLLGVLMVIPLLLLQQILSLVFGRGVADEVVGRLVGKALQAPFRMVVWLVHAFLRR